jgi:hypothetical protein
MDKEYAIRLLDETFSNDFVINRFLKFIKELFKKIEIRERDCTQYITKEYEDYISNLIKLGEYEDNKKRSIEILVVKLNKTSSRDRARTMQRNFIANWLSNDEKYAALVAFYGDDEDWRFSFVKMEYNLMKDETGKVKIVEELTPAKRYSFLVGKNEPNHTCKSRFLEMIEKEDIIISLEEIEEAFSIENVTKEFFLEYKELYLKLKESLDNLIEKNQQVKNDFKEKNISTIDFAKKLLGQIVFIYFLQKKGWLGVEKDEKGRFNEWGTGPKRFLRKLFNKEIASYENFFSDILEPLFYEALATERDDDYYSRFKCKIPFLNGGLFEPINDYNWAENEILLGNNIFENIINTFDRFNFTVKEDEPLEKEVAIDPEMLGKVFENLLEIKDRRSTGRFYTPREIVHYMCQQSLINYLETNTNIPKKDIEKFILLGDSALNAIIKEQEQIKKYGKSYNLNENYNIPKVIKDNYLLIDKLLKEIKIVDPAVGSGAFPVGMMNEIVKARSILTMFFKNDEQKERTSYNLKREAIENSLYGVDNDPSAVDIAKLRFWLSLIVDEIDMKNIKPLPNLDHKIMCGNSLLEDFEGIKLFDERLFGDDKKEYSFEIKRVDKKITELYNEKRDIALGKTKSRTIKEVERDIKKLEKQKENIKNPREKERNLTLAEISEKKIKESQKKLSELEKLQKEYFNEQNRKFKKQLKDDINRIEWELIEETLKEQGNEEAMKRLKQYKENKTKPFFLWKLYFSEVFQRNNPGFDIIIANPPYVKEYTNRHAFDNLRGSEYYQGKMDLWYFFGCIGLDILRNNGVECFIAPNNWISSFGASMFRNKIMEEAQITQFIDFVDYKIFSAGIQTMIFMLEKRRSTEPYYVDYFKIIDENITKEEIIKYLVTNKDGEKMEHFKVNISPQELLDKTISFVNLELNNVLEKIDATGNYRFNENDVSTGIDVHQDFVNDKHLSKLKNSSIKKSDGIFNLTKTEYDNLNLTAKEKTILKPFYTTDELLRYYGNPRNKLWVIYSDVQVRKNIDGYPNIKRHLEKFKSIITSDFGPYGIHRAREQKFFEGQKIVSLRKTALPRFTYTDFPCYVSQTYFVIKPADIDLKYLTGLLNSKLIFFWLKFRGKKQGEQLQIDKEPLLRVPIYKTNDDQRENKTKNEIIELVDSIIKLNQASQKDMISRLNDAVEKQISSYELKIDDLIYKLYRITEEEKKVIEESLKEFHV